MTTPSPLESRREKYHHLVKLLGVAPPLAKELLIGKNVGIYEKDDRPYEGIYLDLPALDEMFSKRDREYDHANALYKGKPCSMKDYVDQKFGAHASKILIELS